ncbi:50S ribosomal protein L20 [Patescibacteria group bacterium]|nr:50S ribosomal protein L20 [Patescibacteria group bacterium]MBU1662987.1 50S ribosomal protein L20 [Patescibacteria group bacterium]MBU1934189.1 50S ribosomal protein L20 [Patescibacteria group bacterium]MBU2008162.1 50S ribosomal protein L20 [Patescibacteria group bacterium]MBU2233655.1 50S ribosomal protein L20 [Patescibacteria group bacterium]
MPRVKRAITHLKKRRNLLKKAKGYKWGRKNLMRAASTAVVKAGVRSYIDRRLKKRDNRALWQIKISAFAKEHGLSYSKFIHLLKINQIEVDRKILADLAVNNKNVLIKILGQILGQK